MTGSSALPARHSTLDPQHVARPSKPESKSLWLSLASDSPQSESLSQSPHATDTETQSSVQSLAFLQASEGGFLTFTSVNMAQGRLPQSDVNVDLGDCVALLFGSISPFRTNRSSQPRSLPSIAWKASMPSDRYYMPWN